MGHIKRGNIRFHHRQLLASLTLETNLLNDAQIPWLTRYLPAHFVHATGIDSHDIVIIPIYENANSLTSQEGRTQTHRFAPRDLVGCTQQAYDAFVSAHHA